MDPCKKILIVEDHPIFRMGLSELINREQDLEVCGYAMDVSTAWRMIEKNKPDMVITDISLENSDGLDLVKKINNHYKDLPVLILSMHDEFVYAERALRAGACGFIMKHEALEVVVEALRQAIDGKLYLSEKVKDHILSNYVVRSHSKSEQSLERLTDRELEVFRMIGQGYRTRDIADKLFLSVKTIGTYRERIKKKLNVKHANALVSYAVHWYKNGSVNPSPKS